MPRESQSLPTKDDAGEVIDYLDEDPEIPTQRYVVLSFLSPERILKQKDQYMFEKFVQWMDYDWKIKGLERYMDFLAKKYSLKVDDLMKDAQEFAKVHNADVKKTDVQEQYQVFLLKNEKDLQESFNADVSFRSNVRGVKVRRAFANVEEAQIFCKVLQRKCPKDNIYLGKMGCWLPWDPSEHMMPEVEYAEKELNELMRKYKEGEANKEMFFAEQREESIRAQKADNERRKRENAASAQPTIEDVVQEAAVPVHPAEGGAPRD
jgi:hypothetical protein